MRDPRRPFMRAMRSLIYARSSDQVVRPSSHRSTRIEEGMTSGIVKAFEIAFFTEQPCLDEYIVIPPLGRSACRQTGPCYPLCPCPKKNVVTQRNVGVNL